MSNYLTNRYQKVVLAGVESNNNLIKLGVPQGSILGPLLFLVYINDFGLNLASDSFLFADDSSLVRSFHIGEKSIAANVLNDDLNKVLEWGSLWKLKFNVSKTDLVIFSPPGRARLTDGSFALAFGNESILPVHVHKHLGVYYFGP
jgi:hypothetical protein